MSKYTDEEIQQIEGLVGELMKINEEQNAKLIAFDAKLKNEEAKVKKLQQNIYFLTQAFTNNTYEA
jgi:hypothetical protein